MSRTSKIHKFHCPDCQKLLATSEGVKCTRCKKIHTFEECFSKELRPDQYYVACLWKPDGSHASTIIIRKEIWFNIGTRKEVAKDCLQYPAFFVYNHIDPSKAFASTAGCRVNKEPIFNFEEALKIAKQHEFEARKNKEWVDAEDVKEPKTE
jgi:phage FluMu protein Com